MKILRIVLFEKQLLKGAFIHHVVKSCKNKIFGLNKNKKNIELTLLIKVSCKLLEGFGPVWPRKNNCYRPEIFQT